MRIIKISAVVLICFAITELILRIFFPLPLEYNTFQTLVRQDILGCKKIVFCEANMFGLRSLSMKTKEKPRNTVRIICLGGSTVSQSTQETADLWSGILEKQLQNIFASRGIKIEVGAAGWPGSTVLQNYNWARGNLLDFQPDIVILAHGINDLCWRGGPGYAYRGIVESTVQEKAAIKNATVEKIKINFLHSSQFFRRIRIAKRGISGYLKLMTGRAFSWNTKNLHNIRLSYRGLSYSENPSRSPDPINEFVDGTEALLRFCIDSGIDTVMLGCPVLWKENMSKEELDVLWFFVWTPQGAVRPAMAWAKKEMGLYNARQKYIAEKFDLDYIDLENRIPADLQHFYDDCHFTDYGHKILALNIFPVVRRHVEDYLAHQRARVN